MTIDPKIYDISYYRSSNYADYLERAHRYKKTAYELADLLVKLCVIKPTSNIVDYGCAVGFLVEAFDELGYQETIGFDISDWAISQGQTRGLRVYKDLGMITQRQTDLLIGLDVFEHMTDEEIESALTKIKPKAMVVRIPSSTDGGKTFHLEVSRADPTHINCKTKEQWIQFFREFGYQTFLKLNLYTVYDTPGVTCLLIL